MVQIKQIICCTLSDRIINIRVRNTDPGVKFIIYGSEFSKVDRISQTRKNSFRQLRRFSVPFPRKFRCLDLLGGLCGFRFWRFLGSDSDRRRSLLIVLLRLPVRIQPVGNKTQERKRPDQRSNEDHSPDCSSFFFFFIHFESLHMFPKTAQTFSNVSRILPNAP